MTDLIDILLKEIEANGDKVGILSVDDLRYVAQDIEKIENTGWLNDFQKFIVNELYDFNLPRISFEIKSILIVATPSSLVNLVFNKKGKKAYTILPPTYADYISAPKSVEEYLKKLMKLYGYHICPAPKLPYKLLAVRSGLSKYGRNNIAYIDGLGSYFNLAVFYSDLPYDKEGLIEISQMDNCQNCTLCMQYCPTNAISENRFLIDNQRCLTCYNEEDGQDFPDWVEESAHNSIVGCIRCQIVCPYNMKQAGTVNKTVEFSEQETDMLLNGSSFESYSFEFREKVEDLGLDNYLTVIPRNLGVLFERG